MIVIPGSSRKNWCISTRTGENRLSLPVDDDADGLQTGGRTGGLLQSARNSNTGASKRETTAASVREKERRRERADQNSRQDLSREGESQSVFCCRPPRRSIQTTRSPLVLTLFGTRPSTHRAGHTDAWVEHTHTPTPSQSRHETVQHLLMLHSATHRTLTGSRETETSVVCFRFHQQVFLWILLKSSVCTSSILIISKDPSYPTLYSCALNQEYPFPSRPSRPDSCDPMCIL